MAESSKPVGRQLLTNVRLESESSSEEEETPQFHKGILKQIEKMEQTRKKNEERKQGREKKDSKQISGKEEEIEFDYAKWVKEQCEKIKKIETECDDEKTVKGTVEECDLNLVSLARPAIELRRFNCKVSAKLRQGAVRTQYPDKICLALPKIATKLPLSNRGRCAALKSTNIFVDQKVSITWQNQRDNKIHRGALI